MSSEMDESLIEIQKELWADYSETVIDHAQNPRNVGNIPNADGFGSATGDCGDTTGIWLKVDNDRIKNVTFWTDGCGTTIAAGSMVTELAKGKTVIQALKINQQSVLDALGGLPEDSAHCAQLAADTLKQAIKDCLASRKEPWKRADRNLD
ncbi:iron-sulfur cluster assembly scaffold protein [Chloroflexota bacterium]